MHCTGSWGESSDTILTSRGHTDEHEFKKRHMAILNCIELYWIGVEGLGFELSLTGLN